MIIPALVIARNLIASIEGQQKNAISVLKWLRLERVKQQILRDMSDDERRAL